MSAKEMFEKANYTLMEKNSAGIKLNMKCYVDIDNNEYVYFWTPTNIEISKDNLSVLEIQAINKQIEELGWLDEK